MFSSVRLESQSLLCSPFFLELLPHREGRGHLTPFLLCLQLLLREVTGPALISRPLELINDILPELSGHVPYSLCPQAGLRLSRGAGLPPRAIRTGAGVLEVSVMGG